MTDNPRRERLRPLLSGLVLRSQADDRLFMLARAGNEQAFSAIYERYRRELRSHAARIVRSDGADDVVQQAALAAWRALLTGAEISDPRAWLHRVVHNAALDAVTRRGYDDGEIPNSSSVLAGTEELAQGRLDAWAALAALAALPGSQRRALTLTAIEGRSAHDAALALGISEAAMRQLVYRARCGVRSAVTALTPLPLVNWLVAAARTPATPAVVSLGAAGAGVPIVAKLVAIVGVTAATLGATHALQSHQNQTRPRTPPTAANQPAHTYGGRSSRTYGPVGQHAPRNEQPQPVLKSGDTQSRRDQHSGVHHDGSSQQGGGNNSDHRSGGPAAAVDGGSQQSAAQQQSAAYVESGGSRPGPQNAAGDLAAQPSEAHPQSARNELTVSPASNTSDGLQGADGSVGAQRSVAEQKPTPDELTVSPPSTPNDGPQMQQSSQTTNQT